METKCFSEGNKVFRQREQSVSLMVTVVKHVDFQRLILLKNLIQVEKKTIYE